MTTTAASLVDRVRDLLDEYGEDTTTLGAAITDTSGTSITLASTEGVAKGNWLSIDYETFFVSEVPTGPPYATTVRRGQRGSTAATHLSAAIVIVNPLYSGARILNALKGALGKMSKIVKDATTLHVIDDQYTYAIPSTIDNVKRVEVENSAEGGEPFIMRNWEMVDGANLRIFGWYDTARHITLVGTSKFSALTGSGNLDAAFPDDNENAINFLVYEAAGQLLLQRQGKIAGRDSYQGMTDAFAQSFPDQSIRTARQYLAEADRFRQIAIRQEPIFQTPPAPTQDPSRIYLMRI
jgi:hypothetical protein